MGVAPVSNQPGLGRVLPIPTTPPVMRPPGFGMPMMMPGIMPGVMPQLPLTLAATQLAKPFGTTAGLGVPPPAISIPQVPLYPQVASYLQQPAAIMASKMMMTAKAAPLKPKPVTLEFNPPVKVEMVTSEAKQEEPPSGHDKPGTPPSSPESIPGKSSASENDVEIDTQPGFRPMSSFVAKRRITDQGAGGAEDDDNVEKEEERQQKRPKIQ